MSVLRNGSQQMGWPNYFQEIIIGVVIIVAVFLDRFRRGDAKVLTPHDGEILHRLRRRRHALAQREHLREGARAVFQLLAKHHDAATVEKALFATEMRNLSLYGYGIKGFTLSAIETAIGLTGGKIEHGRDQRDPRPRPGDARPPRRAPRRRPEALDQLARLPPYPHHEGRPPGPGAQAREIRNRDRFSRRIEIVSEKDAGTYERIFARHGIDPKRFLMVGNSVKSDILPVLKLGGSGNPRALPDHLGPRAGRDSTSDILVNTAANLSGITFQNPSTYTSYYFYSSNSNALTIGSGGITSAAGAGVSLGIPVVLSANQTWNAGSYLQTFDAITGPGSLTTNGYVYLDNYSDTGTTFSGGLTVASGYFSLEDANAAGTGPITIESGSEFYAYNANLPNAVTLGASVTLGSDSEYGFNLTLSGPVTLQSAATSVSIDAYSSITIAGAVSGPASTALSLSSNAYPGTGSLLTYDGGSQVVFQGTLSNVTAVNVSNLSLILAPSGPPASAFNPSASGLLVTNQSYLGLDGTFSSTPMAVSTFLSTYGPTLGPTISGTLGFDTIANPSSPNTFSDAINLSAFTSSSFQGLGSETAAIITGTITPPGNAYPFGGGGGTLTVQSALVDGGSPRSVAMNSTSEPLTVILQSTGNTYTGGTTSNGGVLIFDSPTPTVAGSIQLTGSYSGNVGYVGYTSKATNITAAANFVSLISTSASTGVIGFDTLGGDSPLGPITDPINLTAFGEIGPFLGTSTSATLEGTITPANNQYQFTGVKGGSLTVSSPLTDTAASAVIGLAYPIEAAGTISTVTLSGTNTYTGGTTLNSGAVFISNGSALGTGTISIPSTDHNSPTVPPPSLAPYGSTVTLGNAISVGAGVNGNPAVEFGNYSTTDMLVLNGVISDYPSQSGHVGIQGPVTLNQANTYTGGTTLNGSYSTNVPVYIGNNAAFGTGQITVNEPATLIPDAGGPVALANSIELGDTLTLGQATNPYLLTLNGIINGYYGLAINGPVALNGANTFTGSVVINNAAVSIGNPGALGTGTVALNGSTVTDNFSNPSYLDLTGDSTSMIVLVPSATLTLNTDYYAVPATFQGNIYEQLRADIVTAMKARDTATAHVPSDRGRRDPARLDGPFKPIDDALVVVTLKKGVKNLADAKVEFEKGGAPTWSRPTTPRSSSSRNTCRRESTRRSWTRSWPRPSRSRAPEPQGDGQGDRVLKKRPDAALIDFSAASKLVQAGEASLSSQSRGLDLGARARARIVGSRRRTRAAGLEPPYPR
jgi:autotransporter-associated beta strand protein